MSIQLHYLPTPISQSIAILLYLMHIQSLKTLSVSSLGVFTGNSISLYTRNMIENIQDKSLAISLETPQKQFLVLLKPFQVMFKVHKLQQ
jgi:hypothetical protein